MSNWENYKKTMIQDKTIWSAAKENDIQFLKYAISNTNINAKDHRGYSALMLAAYSGSFEAAQFLLLNGADPNTADFGGNTVLMGAAFKGDLEIVNLLVEHNAHIYLKNHSLMTALDYSILFGRKNVELYLKNLTENQKTLNRLFLFLKFIRQILNQALHSNKGV